VLDALFGRLTTIAMPLREQPAMIQAYLVAATVMFIFGVCMNTLTIALFVLQSETREVGCSFYIIASAAFGLCSLTMFSAKFASLFAFPQMANNFGCIFIEYFLKCLPAICDWFNACVPLERLWSVRAGISFNKNRSKHVAKKIVSLLPFVIAVSVVHDPIHRQSIIDVQLDGGQRSWCVIELSRTFVRTYNLFINIVHYFVPFLLNLISSIIILLRLARNRSRANKQRYNIVIKQQLAAYKSWIISPIVLALLALPRVIFALILTCISLSTPVWQIHLLLIGYFISFLPQIGTFLIFVVPSKRYMEALGKLLKRRH
jgi:hypothetical protein